MAGGEMSAPVAQQVAAAAVKDGLENPQVKKMAAAGNSGMYPWNCARVIEAMWPNMLLRAGLKMVGMPMKFTRGALDVIEEAICVLFAHICRSYASRDPFIIHSICHVLMWPFVMCF